MAPSSSHIPTDTCLLTLPSGLRLAWRHSPLSRVDYFGVSINVGSRDDDSSLPGLAHFVEHTIFKGTLRHRASYFNNRMEAIGGELNAFTTKEETAIYTVAPQGDPGRGIALVAEIVADSTFPPEEIEREREVVVDEIASYRDAPAEAVVDDFEELFFASPSLSHNILGTEQSVRLITSADCRRYIDHWYAPANMVAFYAGPEPCDKIAHLVERHFGANTRTMPHHERAVELAAPFDTVRATGHHQAHTILGAPIPSALSPQRFTYSLLANILGGPGMNALLNVELREKRGLVYSVDASPTLFTDTGIMQIYFGCDHDDVDRCIGIVCHIIRSIADGAITPRKLDKAKRQYLGQLAVASENAESRALSMGRAVTLYGSIPTVAATTAAIQAITPEAISHAASTLTPLRRLTLS